MPKYSGSADIYRELVEDSKENWLYGLVAFAIVEEQRIEWMKHHEVQNGRMLTMQKSRNGMNNNLKACC